MHPETASRQVEFSDISPGVREEVDLIWDYLEEQGGFIIDRNRKVRLNQGSKVPKRIARELIVNLEGRLQSASEAEFRVLQQYVSSKHADERKEKAA